MLPKQSHKIRRQIILMSVFLALVSGAYPYSNWQVFKDDDGSMDSHWGYCGAPGLVLCKTFLLDSVEGAKDAMIHYEMGSDPLHYQRHTSYSKPQEGVQWNDMVIKVNDVVVAKESPMKLGTKGWHKVQFDSKLLKKGKNMVKFMWDGEGTIKGSGGEGCGGFYLGIDTATTNKGRSSSTSRNGTFTTQSLRTWTDEISPLWQGEYMVRLFVAFSDQGGETQDANNAVTEKEPAAAGGEKVVPAVRQFKSFNDYPVGAITDANIKTISGDKCSVKIADVPTWEYFYRHVRTNVYKAENRDPSIPDPNPKTVTNHGAHFVTDPCLELREEGAEAGKHAGAVFTVPEMKKGFIEFDLMADHYEGGGLRVRLGDKAALLINKDGDYYWQAGTNSTKLLDHCQLYPSMNATRFYLPPQKWFTIRIDFDLEMSLANVAMVEMFNGIKCQQTEYLVVGEDLPLPSDAIREVRFETCGAGRFYVDNLFMISRTEDLADDLKRRVPARNIMTAYYPLRKDPIHLKTWSMRHIRFMEGSGCPAGDELLSGDLWNKERYAMLLGCAKEYNEIMVKQAFLGEKTRGLERAWFYGEKTAGEYKAKVEEARQATAKTEALLADLYEFYAACYLDRLNQEKMKDGFEKRHAALTTAIETAETLIQNTLEAMRKEVIKKTQCKFSPYPIEAMDTRTVKLKFSDGAVRRPDGKRDFMFVKSGYLLWPSMEKILGFSPVCPIGATHALRDLKEPEYCNNSTNSYFYHILTGRRDEQVALRIDYGQHNHESALPAWWAEKHKSDPDIFLQNSKGKFSVSQQYNYWNPDVLAAQKATLEGLGDVVVKYGQGARISYIDMAQEAYFLISGPGGTWETGYNPSAVKAFRERLKNKYGDISVLNERWGSKYGNFDEIQPPGDWRLKPERVPGLTCEFERFRQDSWHEWMKQCHAWLRDRLPDKQTPSSCQITYNGANCVDGLDWVKLFETFDIVMEHYSLRFASDPAMYRYLENLREVFKTSTGIGEWYVSADDLFDEQAIRNNGLRQAYQQVQWGRSVLVYWLAHDFCFLHNGNWTENRLGHTVLRYHSAYIPLGIARARAHRAIYLECPLVQPDIGILESESSYYNVCAGQNYGNLFERLIMDGRQDMGKYKVISMPNAACLPDEFVDKLLGWVKDGGILLTMGSPGVMNELGVKSGKLPDEVLGSGQWTYEKGKMSVKEGAGYNVLAQDSSKQPALIEKDCGKGKVYMRLGPVKEEAVSEIISRYAPRKFYGKDNRFHLVMRKGEITGVMYQSMLKLAMRGGPGAEALCRSLMKLLGLGGEKCLYLSVLNPDCYKQLDDEIVLKGEFKTITDISNNFPILPEIRDGKTSFKLSLAPAEGVMIRIQK